MLFIEFIVNLICSGFIAMFYQKDVNSIQEGSAYNYLFTNLNSKDPLPLSDFKGKCLLIVNTASNCGFTKQYKALEWLYKTYKDEGFVVLGVPSNDFGMQEPGTAEDIISFCNLNYGVTFPMTSKEIVSGDNAHPFYKWAKEVLGYGTSPKWNFHKYLVDKNGYIVGYFNPTTAPDSVEIISAIEKQVLEK